MKTTTIRGIPDDIYRELRIAAAEQEKSVNALIVDLITGFIAARSKKNQPKK